VASEGLDWQHQTSGESSAQRTFDDPAELHWEIVSWPWLLRDLSPRSAVGLDPCFDNPPKLAHALATRCARPRSDYVDTPMNAPLHPDHERVGAWRDRDASALEWMTQRLLRIPRVMQRLAFRHAAVPTDVLDDASQEATHTVLRRIDTYHGLAAFDAWVHQVCALTLLGFLRRHRRQSMRSLESEPVDQAATVSQTLDADERRRALHAAIEQLGGVEADVVRQKVLEQLDFADIAERTGIPMATLRTRYYRGISKLRDKLPPPESQECPE
jgi:RNA polymerase sigma-70 factor, ECF subfamily